MKIVIEIPDGYVKVIMANQRTEGSAMDKLIRQAIIDGTPLPKEHGRLIDVGQCDRKLFYQQCGGENSLITVKTAFDMLLSLPTIIEADKESEG